MASSEVAICNLALTYIGDSSITALTDNSDRARACNAHYEDCRDQVLRMHPWNSSIIRKSLAALTDSPPGNGLINLHCLQIRIACGFLRWKIWMIGNGRWRAVS